MNRFFALTGLAVGSFAIILQFSLTIPARMDAGHSLPEAVLFFFSFFTILTNIAAVLAYVAYLFPDRLIAFAAPRVRATITAAITLVGFVYATVLSKLWAPEGLFWLCNALLHYAAPLIYVTWWVRYGRTGTLRWQDAPWMLLFPLAYLCYALLRGQLMSIYPYPFIDVGALGFVRVTLNSIASGILFTLFTLCAIAFDRHHAPPSSSTRAP